MEITRTTLGIAVGIAGTLFLGYCVYFDQQRRRDPLFKKKLREREYFPHLSPESDVKNKILFIVFNYCVTTFTSY